MLAKIQQSFHSLFTKLIQGSHTMSVIHVSPMRSQYCAKYSLEDFFGFMYIHLRVVKDKLRHIKIFKGLFEQKINLNQAAYNSADKKKLYKWKIFIDKQQQEQGYYTRQRKKSSLVIGKSLSFKIEAGYGGGGGGISTSVNQTIPNFLI